MHIAIRRNNDLLRESRSWRYSRRKILMPDEFSGLSGTLEFVTHDGRFSLRSGDVPFTEDTSETGHDWTLLGDQPWRRLYAILDDVTVVPFRSIEPRSASAAPDRRDPKAATTTGAST
jgi:hypothetical protein